MDKKFKKILVVAVALLGLVANSGAAYAAAESFTTVGEDGDTFSLAKDNDEYIVINDNDEHKGTSSLFNLDAGIGVSGLNFQFGGDDDSSIDTGSADGLGESENFMNSNITVISDDEATDTAEATAEVEEDGFAKALAFDNDFVLVKNENEADVWNFTIGGAVSGLNFQYCNDDGGMIETGNADATAKALNEVNSNWTYVSDTEGAVATATVGEDGDAEALAIDNDKFIVKNENEADLFNLSLALALSGGNVQMGGDDDNSIDTGSATANSSANNYVNSNITVLNDNGGAVATSDVNEDTAFETCGATCGTSCNDERCLESEAKAIDNDKMVVVNENEADVVNVSAGVAVSGGNVQGHTDDGGSITTGSASGTSSSSNTVNSNWTSIGSGDSTCGLPSCGE